MSSALSDTHDRIAHEDRNLAGPAVRIGAVVVYLSTTSQFMGWISEYLEGIPDLFVHVAPEGIGNLDLAARKRYRP